MEASTGWYVTCQLQINQPQELLKKYKYCVYFDFFHVGFAVKHKPVFPFPIADGVALRNFLLDW